MGECLLLEIKSNFSSVDQKCHEKKEENPQLEITIKSAMPRRTCPNVPNFPCGDAFSNEEYGKMPANVVVKCALNCKLGSKAPVKAHTGYRYVQFHIPPSSAPVA